MTNANLVAHLRASTSEKEWFEFKRTKLKKSGTSQDSQWVLGDG